MKLRTALLLVGLIVGLICAHTGAVTCAWRPVCSDNCTFSANRNLQRIAVSNPAISVEGVGHTTKATKNSYLSAWLPINPDDYAATKSCCLTIYAPDCDDLVDGVTLQDGLHARVKSSPPVPDAPGNSRIPTFRFVNLVEDIYQMEFSAQLTQSSQLNFGAILSEAVATLSVIVSAESDPQHFSLVLNL